MVEENNNSQIVRKKLEDIATRIKSALPAELALIRLELGDLRDIAAANGINIDSLITSVDTKIRQINNGAIDIIDEEEKTKEQKIAAARKRLDDAYNELANTVDGKKDLDISRRMRRGEEIATEELHDVIARHASLTNEEKAINRQKAKQHAADIEVLREDVRSKEVKLEELHQNFSVVEDRKQKKLLKTQIASHASDIAASKESIEKFEDMIRVWEGSIEAKAKELLGKDAERAKQSQDLQSSTSTLSTTAETAENLRTGIKIVGNKTKESKVQGLPTTVSKKRSAAERRNLASRLQIKGGNQVSPNESVVPTAAPSNKNSRSTSIP